MPDSTQFRLARPIRAHDGAWVVSGWEACQLVTGQADAHRPNDVLRAGIAFHAAITSEQLGAYQPVVALVATHATRRRN